MSVPSWKTTVTTEMPNLEIDRICSTLGSPLIAPSTGKESSDSTSSGEKRRRLRDDLDLHVGEVGHGVDRQVDRRVHPQAGDEDRRHQDQEPVVQRRFDDRIEHGRAFR